MPKDDLAHFILEAVKRVDLSRFKVNERGTGSPQYHPQMMLALLTYAYANGVFSSRRIERATYRDVGFRFLTTDLHPDHDTIAKFRRENAQAFQDCFVEILLLAKELKLLKVGMVSVDGTKMDAHASKHQTVGSKRVDQLRDQLSGEIGELIEQAERADQEDTPDPQQLPEELASLSKLKAKLDKAAARLKQQTREQVEKAQREYKAKVEARDRNKHKGRKIKPPPEQPKEERTNLTDPDSRLMRKNKQSEYRQAYNAQAVVDADGSMMVLAGRVSQSAGDRNELVPDIEAIDDRVGQPKAILADSGYANGAEIEKLQTPECEVLVAPHQTQRRRRHDFRPESKPRPPARQTLAWVDAMNERLNSPEGHSKYRLRKQTVEPVFGIIKQVLGFRHFNLRGLAKVEAEWQLLLLAFNCKRLHRMMIAT